MSGPMARTRSNVAAVLVAGVVGSLTACGGRAPIPKLYTNANSADVWRHPTDHLGARLDVRVTLEGVTSLKGSAVATVRVDNHNVAVHVFDPRFHARTGAQLRVTGIVRGVLGGPEGLGAEGSQVHLPGGTAVIDAQAVSSLDGSPVTVPPPPPCTEGAPRSAHCQTTTRERKPAPSTTSSATETSPKSTQPPYARHSALR
jgi:hypothetical protein